jgi:hypothetical protein
MKTEYQLKCLQLKRTLRFYQQQLGKTETRVDLGNRAQIQSDRVLVRPLGFQFVRNQEKIQLKHALVDVLSV